MLIIMILIRSCEVFVAYIGDASIGNYKVQLCCCDNLKSLSVVVHQCVLQVLWYSLMMISTNGKMEEQCTVEYLWLQKLYSNRMSRNCLSVRYLICIKRLKFSAN